MKTPKTRDRLNHPVASAKWQAIQQAERITYANSDRPQSWRERETYKCPELKHRSMHNRAPSIVMGRRVESHPAA